MNRIVLDAEAGQVSTELTRLGLSSTTRVHALVEVVDGSDLPMGAIADAGKGFEWLADEPDLYTDSDLLDPAS